MAPESLRVANSMIECANSVVVLTGAGISTDSGIPDFRGPEGVWTRDPQAERASNIDSYLHEPEVRRLNWKRRASAEMWPDVNPNVGHEAIVHLERIGKLHTLITQNVDELHQMAGSDPEKTIEIHGTTRKASCLTCGWCAPMAVVLERVRAGETDPHCTECGGILKSSTVSFGQSLNQDDLRRAECAAAEADLFLAVGTSLGVYPINETVAIAKASGAGIVIVNQQPTPFDSHADVVIREPISESLPKIVGMVEI